MGRGEEGGGEEKERGGEEDGEGVEGRRMRRTRRRESRKKRGRRRRRRRKEEEEKKNGEEDGGGENEGGGGRRGGGEGGGGRGDDEESCRFLSVKLSTFIPRSFIIPNRGHFTLSSFRPMKTLMVLNIHGLAKDTTVYWPPPVIRHALSRDLDVDWSVGMPRAEITGRCGNLLVELPGRAGRKNVWICPLAT